jgi:hypothetical protein
VVYANQGNLDPLGVRLRLPLNGRQSGVGGDPGRFECRLWIGTAVEKVLGFDPVEAGDVGVDEGMPRGEVGGCCEASPRLGELRSEIVAFAAALSSAGLGSVP